MTSVLDANSRPNGAVASLIGSRLNLSFESEKDSFGRYDSLSPEVFVQALSTLDQAPGVLALSGWYKSAPELNSKAGVEYFGAAPGSWSTSRFLGAEVDIYRSSHERSNFFGAVGMSPFDSANDRAVLMWEAQLARFCLWSRNGSQIEVRQVLNQPGSRYAALYPRAHSGFPVSGETPPVDGAGKLIATAGLHDGVPRSPDLIGLEALLRLRSVLPFEKRRFQQSVLATSGCLRRSWLGRLPTSPTAFSWFSRQRRMRIPATAHSTRSPGRNHRRSRQANLAVGTGWFSDVFVPPYPNDSGWAIGTGIDAHVQRGGDCSVGWPVYSGTGFEANVAPESAGWVRRDEGPDDLAVRLAKGPAVAGAQERCEIGPRALGNRSHLVSAARPASMDLRNQITGCERSRPIAPMWIERDLGKWLDRSEPCEHMFFRRLLDPTALPSVVLADGTAGVQSVSNRSNPRVAKLLRAVRELEGAVVLCNTSPNFKGWRFINRTSDLLTFCARAQVDDAVIEEIWYEAPSTASSTSSAVACG